MACKQRDLPSPRVNLSINQSSSLLLTLSINQSIFSSPINQVVALKFELIDCVHL